MNAHHDPIVRIELVAAVCGKSYESLNRAVRLGRMPKKDVDGRLRGWRLSTVHAWNPRLAERIDDLLKTNYLPAA